MEGMRYERGGKGKYWIPKPSARTGLLQGPGPSSMTRQISPTEGEQGENRAWRGGNYGAKEETDINDEDEKLYENARALEYGDYNYPVVTANKPKYSGHRCIYDDESPALTTTATNQALLRPALKKGKKSPPSRSSKKGSKAESSKPLLQRTSSSSSTISGSGSENSGIVDLIVEDTVAEETERVRARKEGGPGWNEVEPKRFVRKWPPEEAGEEYREGFEPLNTPPIEGVDKRNEIQGDPEGSNFTIGDDEDDDSQSASRETPQAEDSRSPWDEHNEGENQEFRGVGSYSSLNERDVWGR